MHNKIKDAKARIIKPSIALIILVVIFALTVSSTLTNMQKTTVFCGCKMRFANTIEHVKNFLK